MYAMRSTGCRLVVCCGPFPKAWVRCVPANRCEGMVRLEVRGLPKPIAQRTIRADTEILYVVKLDFLVPRTTAPGYRIDRYMMLSLIIAHSITFARNSHLCAVVNQHSSYAKTPV